MSGNRDTSRESQITTDTDTIRGWGDTHELTPVRYEEDGETRLALVRESEMGEHHDRMDWGDFEGELRDREMVVVRHDESAGDVDVVERTEAVGTAALTTEEVEEELIEGETIESEFTERAVVEHTVVEEVTVESEVTDREMVESDTVDAELITRDVEHCEVTSVDTTDAGIEALGTFGTGTRSDLACDVAVTIDEAWTVTKENVERITIESRIVEADVEETETVESDTVRETVDIEGVERTVLEGELVDSPETARVAVEEGNVESRFREDDAIETHLLRSQTIEEEVSIRREVTGEIADAETLASETISHAAVESEIVDAADYDRELAVGPSTTADERTAGVDDTETLEADEPATEEPATAERSAGETARIEPTDDDVGKTVVNASGDEVGMVSAVENDRMYVDPHPSITDRIRTALGWGSDDDDTYPVDEEHVSRIEDDEVVLGVDRQG
ncbi:hypothetical protein C475_21449 [Halosimplex carlsbadense 2-9-1]|uniref:PRC-barrel domain-containing protein n=1 Tax=Halosimplex carlsbadense 2-9-1 TaxID=797114 RepID=M0C9E9_9EURY|nr:hypothetical protein [Halosimplex carlsbadense]ELZ19906.1 hypothetical protein C475_21449 [Halosimplex carlsbadense 2-9-1]